MGSKGSWALGFAAPPQHLCGWAVTGKAMCPGARPGLGSALSAGNRRAMCPWEGDEPPPTSCCAGGRVISFGCKMRAVLPCLARLSRLPSPGGEGE